MGEFESRAAVAVHKLEGERYDFQSPSMIVMSEEEWLVGQGMLFSYSINELDIPDGNARDTLVRIGPKAMNFRRLAINASEGPILLTFFESPTLESPEGGVDKTPTLINMNRTSDRLPTIQVVADVATVDPGSPILGSLYIPAQGNAGVRGTTGAVQKAIFKPNTDYLIRFFNDPLGAGTADVYAVMVWDELTPEEFFYEDQR